MVVGAIVTGNLQSRVYLSLLVALYACWIPVVVMQHPTRWPPEIDRLDPPLHADELQMLKTTHRRMWITWAVLVIILLLSLVSHMALLIG